MHPRGLSEGYAGAFYVFQRAQIPANNKPGAILVVRPNRENQLVRILAGYIISSRDLGKRSWELLEQSRYHLSGAYGCLSSA
jgi:hypothetical protein